MTKQEQIEEYLKKPYKVGDMVEIAVPYITTKREKKGRKYITVNSEQLFNSYGEVADVNGNNISVKLPSYKSPPSELRQSWSYDAPFIVHSNNVKHVVDHIGANPFIDDKWDSRITFYQADIQQLIWRTEPREYDKYTINGITIQEIDWTPFVIRNNEEIGFQRDFCWDLYDKQLLIDSIYNNIEIGKFIIRKRSWKWVEDRANLGKQPIAFNDIIDGKQRLKAILDFKNNIFPDKNGNFYDDLSGIAQRRFKSFNRLTYGEMGEGATDDQVLHTFLSVNHTGKPMSEEHINYVKSIYAK